MRCSAQQRGRKKKKKKKIPVSSAFFPFQASDGLEEALPCWGRQPAFSPLIQALIPTPETMFHLSTLWPVKAT